MTAARPTPGGSPGTWAADLETSLAVSLLSSNGALKQGRTVKAYGAQGDNSTNDTAAITAAFNDYANGSVVVIPAGTYMVDNLTVPSGISHVVAQGGATFKKRANGALLTVNGNQTVLDGLSLDGQGATFSGYVVHVSATVTDVTVQNCRLINAPATQPFPIQAESTAHRLTVRNCYIEGGVLVQQSDCLLVDGCKFFPASVNVAGTFGVNVQCTDPAAGQSADYARIVNNYFEIPATNFAICPLMRNAAQKPRGTVIANNVMVAVGNCYGGISVDSCTDAVVVGNSFRVESGTPSTGALELAASSNVTVIGNDFDGGGVMEQVVSVNTSSDCSITGNTFRSPITTGTTFSLLRFFAPSAATHCYRNVVANNKFVNPSGANGMIMLAPNNATASIEETLIAGNSFYGNASSRGIVLDATAAAGSVLRTTIQNNHFVTLATGVRFFQDDQTVVSGNRFASDVTARFSQGGSSTNVHVENNDFQLAAVVPASQSHFIGERVYHSAPAVGSPTGWVCTVTGTPGTWVALPNL